MPRIPRPPPGLDPLLETLASGTQLWRGHEDKLGSNEFNPGHGRGRFHPLTDPRTGSPIPTMYGADSVPGALSESAFRSVPVRGPGKRLMRSALASLCLSSLVITRDVTLANLSGHGLPRIGARRIELIESPASSYAATARWAEAIHQDTSADGLLWVSRQNDRSLAVLLFGDRVASSDLDVLVDRLPLASGTGWNLVLASAESCGITIVV